jgi:hypothetical protein
MNMTETKTARRRVNLPEELCAALEKKFGAQFESLESLLEFVLRELTGDAAEALDQSEQAALEKRLRDLGYI